MSAVRYSNFFRTTIANTGGITAAAVSLTLTSADGMPSLGVGDWTYLVLINLDTLAKEIVKVAAISGAVCTIERGQDGTTALAFDQYDTVELRVCKAMLDDLMDAATEEADALAADAKALATAANDNADAAVAAAEAAGTTAAAATVAAAAAQATADAALPKAGGTMTGAVTFSGLATFLGGTAGVGNRIGDIVMRLTGATISGLLVCDGAQYSAVDNPEYEDLYNHLAGISSAYVVDSDTKTFAMPNLQGLLPIGIGTRVVESVQRTFAAGEVQGEYEHALVEEEMPYHNHPTSQGVLQYNGSSGTYTLPVTVDGADKNCKFNSSVPTVFKGGTISHENLPPVFPLSFFMVYA